MILSKKPPIKFGELNKRYVSLPPAKAKMTDLVGMVLERG